MNTSHQAVPVDPVQEYPENIKDAHEFLNLGFNPFDRLVGASSAVCGVWFTQRLAALRQDVTQTLYPNDPSKGQCVG